MAWPLVWHFLSERLDLCPFTCWEGIFPEVIFSSWVNKPAKCDHFSRRTIIPPDQRMVISGLGSICLVRELLPDEGLEVKLINAAIPHPIAIASKHPHESLMFKCFVVGQAFYSIKSIYLACLLSRSLPSTYSHSHWRPGVAIWLSYSWDWPCRLSWQGPLWCQCPRIWWV